MPQATSAPQPTEPQQEQPQAGPPPRVRREYAPAVPVGAQVYYRLKKEPHPLRPATVIDTFTEFSGMETKLPRPATGTVHLEVYFEQAEDSAASERGLRKDVSEGNEPGEFTRDWPANESAEHERRVQRLEILNEENRKRAQPKRV